MSADHRPLSVPHFEVASKITCMAARLYLHRCREAAAPLLEQGGPISCFLVTDGSRVARQDYMVVNIFLNGMSLVGLPQVSP